MKIHIHKPFILHFLIKIVFGFFDTEKYWITLLTTITIILAALDVLLTPVMCTSLLCNLSYSV